MDEPRVWGVARSPVQIQRDMGAVLSGSESGLAGYWRFGEGSGTAVADLSPNGNNGTLGGYTRPVVPARFPGAPALGGSSLLFDGANDFVEMGNPANGTLDIGTSATLEAWVKFNALPTNSIATVASKDVGGGNTNKWIFGYANNFAGVSNGTFLHINTASGANVWLKSNSWTPAVGPGTTGRGQERQFLHLLSQRRERRHGQHDDRGPGREFDVPGRPGRRGVQLQRPDRRPAAVERRASATDISQNFNTTLDPSANPAWPATGSLTKPRPHRRGRTSNHNDGHLGGTNLLYTPAWVTTGAPSLAARWRSARPPPSCCPTT